jgi:hypothetical protein
MEIPSAMIDPLMRFSPIPYTANVSLWGTTAQIETNSKVLLDRLYSEGALASGQDAAYPVCILKIVAEQDQPTVSGTDSLITWYGGDDQLAVFSFGQDGFLAYDRGKGLGISFISEKLVRSEELFATHFVPGLKHVLAQIGTTA